MKLSLNQVKVEFSETQLGNEQAMQYIEQLLTDCIHERRRISHDLMPAILKEHALKEAVADICRRLTNGVKFNSNIQSVIR